MTKEQKEQFEYWLIGNMSLDTLTAHLIIKHVEHYFVADESIEQPNQEDLWHEIMEDLQISVNLLDSLEFWKSRYTLNRK